MALVKKTIELDQDQINRIRIALNAKSEKEALNAVLSQFDTEIQLADVTLRDAGTFDFDQMWRCKKKLFSTPTFTSAFSTEDCTLTRSTGKMDPRNPKQYNDVCIALLAGQVGATVVTLDISDFKRIQSVVDFRFRDVIKEA